jgi:raffinose/stachyose/melibiose transport system substrate-binding protein
VETTDAPHSSSRLSRRSVLKAAALGTLAGPVLSACGGGGGNTLRFYQSKPEVLGYFDEIIAGYEKQQSAIKVVHDSTSSLVASFVRDDPHDLACNNYDLSAGVFVSRDVLSNLAGLPEAQLIDPSVQELVGQYAPNRTETNVIPYSITAAGVIYNKDLFAQHGVNVPTTWTELINACETFKSKGVTPIYATYSGATWTIQQGLFDYVSGSALDVDDFYTKLKAQGTDVASGSEVSFEKNFNAAVDKMLQLAAYSNPDAPSRTYPDGNVAFAQGKAAMYMQGPWAIGEVAKANPKANVGTFALPATDNPQDRKARVNLDLALWIPKGAANPDAARRFLSYLMRPEVMNKYNNDNLAYSPVKNPPAVTDKRIEGLQSYVREGRFYQGAGTYVPSTIPLGNYLQEMVLTKDGSGFLRKLDSDWRRLAQRSV